MRRGAPTCSACMVSLLSLFSGNTEFGSTTYLSSLQGAIRVINHVHARSRAGKHARGGACSVSNKMTTSGGVRGKGRKNNDQYLNPAPKSLPDVGPMFLFLAPPGQAP